MKGDKSRGATQIIKIDFNLWFRAIFGGEKGRKNGEEKKGSNAKYKDLTTLSCGY